MLQLSAAGKRFGPKLLFEDANWLITPDERTGLVGGNGTGKSTLLKILAGVETLDYGALTRVKGMTIGYLPQDGLALRGKTVFAECLSVFDHLHALEAESLALTHTLAEADPKSKEYAVAAERYSDIADQLHVHDIYTLDAQVGAVLGGVPYLSGITPEMQNILLRLHHEKSNPRAAKQLRAAKAGLEMLGERGGLIFKEMEKAVGAKQAKVQQLRAAKAAAEKSFVV